MKPQRLKRIKQLNRAWRELIDWQDPIKTMVRVIEELIPEVDLIELTKAQRHLLAQAYRLAPNDYLSFAVRARAGGAIQRMIERMCQTGLIYGPPYRITTLGRLTHERISREKKSDV